MTLLLNMIYYYGFLVSVLAVAWLIGMSINIGLANYLNKQSIVMPNFSTSLFIAVTTGLAIIIYGLFFIALLGVLNLTTIILTTVLLIIASLIFLRNRRRDQRQAPGMEP